MIRQRPGQGSRTKDAIFLCDLTLSYDSNFCWTKSPPPLCDFMQAKDFVEQQARWAAERWRRMKHEEQREEKRKKEQEEIRKRMEEVDRKAAAEHEADREIKRERARRAKEAGPETISKGKYPRCTQ